MTTPVSAVDRSRAGPRWTVARRAILRRRVAEMWLLTAAFFLAWLALAAPANLVPT
jgi:hypothetical protein